MRRVGTRDDRGRAGTQVHLCHPLCVAQVMTEAELYRYLDVGAGQFHLVQTHEIVGGRLVFIRQGHGTLSLVLVLGRPDAAAPPEHEFSILVRGSSA